MSHWLYWTTSYYTYYTTSTQVLRAPARSSYRTISKLLRKVNLVDLIKLDVLETLLEVGHYIVCELSILV